MTKNESSSTSDSGFEVRKGLKWIDRALIPILPWTFPEPSLYTFPVYLPWTCRNLKEALETFRYLHTNLNFNLSGIGRATMRTNVYPMTYCYFVEAAANQRVALPVMNRKKINVFVQAKCSPLLNEWTRQEQEQEQEKKLLGDKSKLPKNIYREAGRDY